MNASLQSNESGTTIHSHCILVVDDNPIQIEVFLHALGDLHKTLTANSVAAAQSMIAEHPEIDLILLDIEMPYSSGLELGEELKANPVTSHIPIIFVSGVTDIEAKKTAFKVGGVDYITKPFDTEELKVRVDSHLAIVTKTQELVSMAYTDPLTQAFNRRKYNETIILEWQRATRHGYPLTLLIFDIDNFKHYNDHYGHTAGDQALHLTAKALNPLAHRSGDVFCRYGGEEFVLLLPECSKDGAETIAKQASKLMTQANIKHEGICDTGLVTLSIGIATAVPSHFTDPLDLFRQADLALYQAKQNGRNTYVVAD